MKSPITGKEMKHGYEPAVWTFRGTEYPYIRESELAVLNRVCEKLGKLSSGDISKLSHQEDAWINFHEGHHPINFDTAFSLCAL